jgi:hypothetical protein
MSSGNGEDSINEGDDSDDNDNWCNGWE